VIDDRVKWVKMEGQTYKPNAAVLCGTTEEDLEIILISKIYTINNQLLYFKGQTCILANYNRHLRAHILSPTNKETYVLYDTNASQEHYHTKQS